MAQCEGFKGCFITQNEWILHGAECFKLKSPFIWQMKYCMYETDFPTKVSMTFETNQENFEMVLVISNSSQNKLLHF